MPSLRPLRCKTLTMIKQTGLWEISIPESATPQSSVGLNKAECLDVLTLLGRISSRSASLHSKAERLLSPPLAANQPSLWPLQLSPKQEITLCRRELSPERLHLSAEIDDKVLSSYLYGGVSDIQSEQKQRITHVLRSPGRPTISSKVVHDIHRP